jgi:Mn-dependent DtxR family transcriptional regulator
MLGVRRQTVSEVAAGLQRAGIVSYRRGMMTIRDRRRLENGSCECYGVLRSYYDKALQPGKLLPAAPGT